MIKITLAATVLALTNSLSIDKTLNGDDKRVGETENNRSSEETKKTGGANVNLGEDKKKTNSVLNSLFLSGKCPSVNLMSSNIEGKLLEGDWYTLRTVGINSFTETKCFHTAVKWDEAT